jgi:hypothetical protein
MTMSPTEYLQRATHAVTALQVWASKPDSPGRKAIWLARRTLLELEEYDFRFCLPRRVRGVFEEQSELRFFLHTCRLTHERLLSGREPPPGRPTLIEDSLLLYRRRSGEEMIF